VTVGGGFYTVRNTLGSDVEGTKWFENLPTILGRGWQLSPLAECFWHPVAALDFWVKFSPEVVLPKFNQLYGLNDYVRTNFALRPERRYIVLKEGGKYQFKKYLTLQIDLSQERIRDFIAWQDDAEGVTEPFNLEEVDTISGKVSLKYNWHQKIIQELNYTYRKTFPESIPYSPEHRVGFITKVELPGQQPFSALRFCLQGQFWSKQYRSQDKDLSPLPGGQVINLKISREINQHFLVFLSWQNLFQEEYWIRYIYPRRASILLLGVKGKF